MKLTNAFVTIDIRPGSKNNNINPKSKGTVLVAILSTDTLHAPAQVDQSAPPVLLKVRTIDNEPLSDQVLYGKQLFFNAMDTRMSAVGYMSCAACHFAEHTPALT